MKKIKIISLGILMLFLLSVVIVPSYAVSPDNYAYKVDDVYFPEDVKNDGTWFYVIPENSKEITLLGYRGDEKNIVIPQEIDGYPVTTISVYGYALWWGGVEETAFPIFKNSIESITIPKTVTQIVSGIENDFSPRFHKLTDQDGFTYFKGHFKSGLTNLKEFIVDKENKYFSSKDGVLFNKEKTVLISYPRKKSTIDYTVPNTVKYILDYAFYRVNESSILKEITITENVEAIGWLSGNEWDYSIDTLVIKNIKITKEELKSKLWGDKEIVVYQNSIAHKYYKNYIANKNVGNKPKLTIVDNPYAEKDDENTVYETEPNIIKPIDSETESSKIVETEEILTIGATDNNVNDKTEPKKTSKVWIIVAVMVFLLAGGGTANFIIKRKKTN